MSFFDTLFFNVFNYYKNSRFKKSAINIALYYITIVQGSLLLLLGVFFSEFFNQMNVITMSSIKAWTLYVIAVVILLFKNWIQYSGKRRNILNAKQKRKSGYSIWTLWLIPIICVFLSILMLKVF
ncbi:hypothetical protein [Aquaticitalea lipolytica]|jgi:protein-S-isoprenylcysteine O-methyltransferase Ste14|uniref:hypothetical protein n=1 Tax=Aquaticitalea lipolytica TaxID=1247562 RepID=UPI0024B92AA6|nr:hypothetical protein [Aquaticitalea lipolytica]